MAKPAKMKICLLNTTDITGGAAIACNRLTAALCKNNTEAVQLVQKQTSDKPFVKSTTKLMVGKYQQFIHFIREVRAVSKVVKSKDLMFSFSLAKHGEDISSHHLVKQADIIHLHWINQGFLSLRGIDKLTGLGKPMVWTLHDMWAFTGGCHYTGECEQYVEQCGNCPLLKTPARHDISYQAWQRKRNIIKNANITFVTCSNWLGNVARKSPMLHDRKVISIPNPINTELFKPRPQSKTRLNLHLPTDKYLILFGAANIMDKRKGLLYLIDALELIKKKYPNKADKIELVIFGKANKNMTDLLPMKSYNLSYISTPQQIVEAYSIADLFVLPSLEDNLPNTVMEAMACGTPVVAFNIGGIPQMIDHKQNGYLATYKSTLDLAEGVVQMLFGTENTDAIKQAARKKILETFNEKTIAGYYTKLYSELLNNE